eukprot:GEMP01009953.1.p1 GENE.GEMP01009953.1~~GEMP01009953.1.p1  ORF type:complete len:493 (+),score=118.19 GEMP01009953.1:26-1504(+)
MEADVVARLVLEKYDKLPQRGKPQGREWTVLCGIVGERAGVVSLATGTRCIGQKLLKEGQGYRLHDCHAEVLCKRAFQRYVLECGADDVFHMYVSDLPCGECTLVPLTSDEGSRARTRTPDEMADAGDLNRTGAKPATGFENADPKGTAENFHATNILRFKPGRSDTLPENASISYSCSDKICRWSVLGYQGSLLQEFMAPIHMTSIVLGGPLFHAWCVDALSRGTKITVRHTTVPFKHFRTDGPTSGLSIAWCKWNNGCETHPESISNKTSGLYDVIVGHTGLRHGTKKTAKAPSCCSVFSKRRFFDAFLRRFTTQSSSTSPSSLSRQKPEKRLGQSTRPDDEVTQSPARPSCSSSKTDPASPSGDTVPTTDGREVGHHARAQDETKDIPAAAKVSEKAPSVASRTTKADISGEKKNTGATRDDDDDDDGDDRSSRAKRQHTMAYCEWKCTAAGGQCVAAKHSFHSVHPWNTWEPKWKLFTEVDHWVREKL